MTAGGAGERPSFVGHARTVGGLTLLSRCSGLLRDAVASRVFGASLVWSAFVTAFAIPNLFRRLFGEGALSGAFIPAYAKALEAPDRAEADRLASLTVGLLWGLLWAIVAVAEAALAVVFFSLSADGGARLLVLLTMIMLPYMPLVCGTAVLGGMLQAHGRFGPHAAAPIVLNVFMAAAAGWFGLRGGRLEDAAAAVGVAVVIAGVIQFAWCLWSLRLHASWTRRAWAAWPAARRMLARMLPVVIGLGALQLSTLADAAIAGAPVAMGATVSIAGRTVGYPLDEAAASVLFYAQRLYQLPLGVFGIAVATAVFPALARRAGRGSAFGRTLGHGLRLSLFIGLPASAGLWLVREPLVGVIYRGGDFGQADAARVAWVLAGYAPAVWAYSLTHVLTRAFYASDMTRVPMRIGLYAVSANVALNLVLMWPLGEAGLAWATSAAAIGQCAALLVAARRRLPGGAGAFDGALLRSAGWSIGLTGAMTLAVLAGRTAAPLDASGGWAALAGVLTRDAAVGAAAYLGASWAVGRQEIRWLVRRQGASGED